MTSHPGRSVATKVIRTSRTSTVPAMVSSSSGEGAVGKHHLAAGEDRGQLSLARCSCPGLGDHRCHDHSTLTGALDFGGQRPGISVCAVESDECPCVEQPQVAGGLLRRRDGSPVVLSRAASMSSSVMAPAQGFLGGKSTRRRSSTSGLKWNTDGMPATRRRYVVAEWPS